jgi:hypothetical protein
MPTLEMILSASLGVLPLSSIAAIPLGLGISSTSWFGILCICSSRLLRDSLHTLLYGEAFVLDPQISIGRS